MKNNNILELKSVYDKKWKDFPKIKIIYRFFRISLIKIYIKENIEGVSDEIADIAMYLFELADNIWIDLIQAMEKKLKKNETKYPIEKAKSKHTKYNKL